MRTVLLRVDGEVQAELVTRSRAQVRGVEVGGDGGSHGIAQLLLEGKSEARVGGLELGLEGGGLVELILSRKLEGGHFVLGELLRHIHGEVNIVAHTAEEGETVDIGLINVVVGHGIELAAVLKGELVVLLGHLGLGQIHDGISTGEEAVVLGDSAALEGRLASSRERVGQHGVEGGRGVLVVHGSLDGAILALLFTGQSGLQALNALVFNRALHYELVSSARN